LHAKTIKISTGLGRCGKNQVNCRLSQTAVCALNYIPDFSFPSERREAGAPKPFGIRIDLRLALLPGKTITDVVPEIATLFMFCFILLPISLRVLT